MKHLKRLTMTLALLITAATGAWAGETVETTLWEGTYPEDGVEINSTTVSEFNAGDVLRVYVDIPDGGANFKIVYKGASNNWEETTIPSVGNQWPWLNGGDTYTYMDVTFTEADITALTGMGIYIYNGEESTITKVTLITPASGPAVTLNDTKTEASFTMPQYDVTVAYTLKRDMTVDVAGEMADRIRIKKDGNDYQAVDATQMNPVVKDILETNSPVTLTVTTDYTLQLQKQSETDETVWTDVTALSVGTFRYKITGAGNYSGICYSEEFALFQGYEVTVGAGEYATFYKDENLYTEDADAELYTIASVTATEAVLSDKLKVVAAGTPMLIFNKGTEANTFLLIPTEDQADDVTAADQFQGTAEGKEFTADDMAAADYYVCTGNAFVWVKSAGTIAANRCWLEIIAQPAGVRSNSRSIVSGGDTTNIDATTRDALEGDYYDLQGRKVEKPLRKGIYIKSGKKVIKH